MPCNLGKGINMDTYVPTMSVALRSRVHWVAQKTPMGHHQV